MSGYVLPTLDRGIDIERIDLEAIAAPAGLLGGENRRAAAAKGIENDVVTLGRIQDRVRHHGDRFDRGMQVKSASPSFAWKAIGAGVVPDICAIAAEAAELDIVAVALFAVPEHEHKFMRER